MMSDSYPIMRVISKEEFQKKKDAIVHEIKTGAVFIYPTDTIYGIGCNAMIDKAVQRIRSIKSRYTRPFSVIAPSVEWIQDNCVVTDDAEKWLTNLPGPLTLIMSLKSKEMISEHVNSGLDTLGVRIPHHWFTEVVTEVGYPIITTSANKVGENFMTSLEDLDPSIANEIDFVIYDGPKEGRPSKLVHLEGDAIEIKER
jgi:L-threonylcarbamoyladenylate synthase